MTVYKAVVEAVCDVDGCFGKLLDVLLLWSKVRVSQQPASFAQMLSAPAPGKMDALIYCCN